MILEFYGRDGAQIAGCCAASQDFIDKNLPAVSALARARGFSVSVVGDAMRDVDPIDLTFTELTAVEWYLRTLRDPS